MSTNEEYTVRQATLDDVAIISHQRIAMFRDMGYDDTPSLSAMDEPFREWVANKLDAGVYLGWFALDGDQVIAGAGLWLSEWIPHPYDPRGVRGYILNVYTEQPYRNQGIARALVSLIIDYCRDHAIHVVALHASDQGRSIYEALGFAASNEMRMHLK